MTETQRSDSGRGAARCGPVAGVLGRLLSKGYEWELMRRSRRFDRGVGVVRLDRAVVSVGNLSVGGTGKTPMVQRVCAWLMEAGHRPCVAMRGYRAGAEGSDEAQEHAGVMAGVPVVVGPDRAERLRDFFESESGRVVEVVVLDDGFQHRQLARDVDVVLIDASRSPFEDALLPAGWLRERAEALGRAHAVVLTHAEHVAEAEVERLIERCLVVQPKLAMAVTWHHWAGVQVIEGDAERREPVSWLNGRRVLALCGIGNADAFVAEASAAAGGLAGSVVLRDHARYDERVRARIVREVKRSGAEVVLTTRKDAVKIARWGGDVFGASLAVAQLELKFVRGEEDVRGLVLSGAGKGGRIR